MHYSKAKCVVEFGNGSNPDQKYGDWRVEVVANLWSSCYVQQKVRVCSGCGRGRPLQLCCSNSPILQEGMEQLVVEKWG